MTDGWRGDFDLTAARTFVCVVEAGGISAAARRMGLSKSVVSGRIRALEERTGATLVNRARQLTLTDRGRSFLESVKIIIAQIDSLRKSIAENPEELIGRVRISLSTGLGTRYLGTLICEFLSHHKQLEGYLDYSDRYVDPSSDDYDIIFRIGQPVDSALIGRRLCTIKRIACVSPEYIEKFGMPKSINDLQHHAGVAYSIAQDSGQWSFFDREKKKIIHARSPKIMITSNSGDGMRDAALSGIGIAVLPSFFVSNDLKEGRLCEINFEHHPLSSELWALHMPRRERREAAQIMIAWLRDRIGDPPFWELW